MILTIKFFKGNTFIPESFYKLLNATHANSGLLSPENVTTETAQNTIWRLKLSLSL